MKVLRKKKPGPYGWSKDLTCTGFGNAQEGCGSLLRVKYKDLVYYPGVSGDTWGSRDPAISFQCPVCDTCTDLGIENWPVDRKNLPVVGASWYKTTYKQNVFGEVEPDK